MKKGQKLNIQKRARVDDEIEHKKEHWKNVKCFKIR